MHFGKGSERTIHQPYRSSRLIDIFSTSELFSNNLAAIFVLALLSVVAM